MAGNRNSGRRPKPPSPEDALSEAILEVAELVAEYQYAEDQDSRQHLRHRSAQRHRMNELCQLVAGLANGWRDIRGLYPPDAQSVVVDLAAQRELRRGPSRPVAA